MLKPFNFRAAMIIRRAKDRGKANFDWLNSKHSFSFGHYYDPRYMGFGPLRVINDDRVDGGAGFPPHSHADMEIISYVVEGGLEHKDSIGTGSVILPGDVQRMSAGRGIRHSEYNASKTQTVRFLQIWILPDTRGIPPGYEQSVFSSPPLNMKTLKLVGSRSGRNESITIHQDVDLYAGRIDGKQKTAIEFNVRQGRKVWVQIVKGSVRLAGKPLSEGDGVAIDSATSLRFTDGKNAEFCYLT